MTVEVKDLARIIFDSVRFRHGSYSYKMVREAENAEDRPDSIDYGQFYLVSVEEAIKKACKRNGVDGRVEFLIYLALDSWQNDAIAWAEEVLGEKLCLTPA